jgi:hypothetical protein
MTLESAQSLRSRLKLGREEYCQRLLTMLILAAPYPKWNSTNSPSERGVRFLAALDELSFGEHSRLAAADFIDEFDLPKRVNDPRGGACDYAVVWADRLWLIELKTEASSWRPDQLPTYFVLGAHHHPAHHLDITYLTPPMPDHPLEIPPGSHYAHLLWDDVAPLIAATWADGSDWEVDATNTLLSVLSEIGTPWTTSGPATVSTDKALDLADLVGLDGCQRALDVEAGGLDELYQWRMEVEQALRTAPPGSPRRTVRAWVWKATTSGGKALTQAGGTTGFELRFSRSTKPV